MSRGGPLLLALNVLLGACGGGSGGGGDQGPPEDEVLTGLAGSATRALELDQPESAARLYAQALDRARERDDAGAIADTGFGQATSLLASGDAPGALRVSRDVRTELARRGRTVTPRLTLVEATALHRLGRPGEAAPLAVDVAGRGAEDPSAALRARFLLGLIAAGRGDAAGVAAAREAVEGARESAFRADAMELAAHEALLRGNPRGAATEAAAAAALRQDALDYRGLARSLALEGRARTQLGQPAEAADLLLRAGKSAAARGERADARRWLEEAARLAGTAGRPALQAEARRGLAGLSTRPE